MSAFTESFAPLGGLLKRAFSPDPPDEDIEAPDEDLALATLSRAERIRMAFDEIPLSEQEHRALKALMDAPGSTAQELSHACGWMSSGWRTQMLLLCQRRRRYLWPGGIASDMTNGIIITALTEYSSEKLTFRPRAELASLLKAALAKR